jgi:Arc/MetJ-type ribon-helix-helix transcriptional regulator
MIRTQIQLTESQAAELRALAAREGVSMAELVRRAVDRIVTDHHRQAAWERADSVVGRFRGPGGNVSENHDDHLVDAYSS